MYFTKRFIEFIVVISLGFGALAAVADTALVSAVLPNSRSVQVNQPATVFATIINAGAETGRNCRVEVDRGEGWTFSYQTTNSATNELTGTANTPIDLAPGSAQSFLLALSSNAATGTRQIQPLFLCDNAPAATVTDFVNTFFFSASDEPVPDVIALAATPSADGIVTLPNRVSASVFTVAAVNVGAPGEIIAEPIRTAGLGDVGFSICQTDPVTSVCVNPSTPTQGSVVLTLGAQATATFGVFVSGERDYDFSPAVNRALVFFSDSDSGRLRGATSVTVTTRVRSSDEPLQISPSMAQELVRHPIRFAGDTLNLQGAVLSALISFQRSGDTSLIESCGAGTEAWVKNDADSDLALSTGDTFAGQFAQCRNSYLSATTTGSLTGSVSFFEIDANGYIRLTGNVVIDGVLEVGTYTVSGSYAFSYVVGPAGTFSQLQPLGDSVFTFVEGGDTSVWRNFAVEQQVGTTENTMSIAGDLEDEGLGGSTSCELVDATGPRGARDPDTGTLRCTGSEGGSVSLVSVPNELATLSLRRSDAQGEELVATNVNWSTLARGDSPFPGHFQLRPRPPEGLAGYVVQELAIDVNDILHNPGRNELIVAGEEGLTVLDAGTLATLRNQSFSSTPSRLTFSEDAQSIYVRLLSSPMVEVVDSVSLSSTGSFTVPVDENDRAYGVLQLFALPGASNRLLLFLSPVQLSFEDARDPYLAVYENGVELPNTVDLSRFLNQRVFFSDSGRAFVAWQTEEFVSGLMELMIDAQGISTGEFLSGVDTGITNIVAVAGEKLISAGGVVYDLDTGFIAGSLQGLPGGSGADVFITDEANRFLFAPRLSLNVFDLQNFSRVVVEPIDLFRFTASAVSADTVFMADEDGIAAFPKAGLIDRPLKSCETTNLQDFGGPPGASFDCTVNAAVFDASRGTFLATLASDEGVYANSFATIDPQSGVLGAPTYVGSSPSALALASDNESVYLGLLGTNAVVDLNLSSLQPSIATRLQSGSLSFFRASLLDASDDDPGRLLMGIGSSSNSPSRIALLQDGILAENPAETFSIETLAFDPVDNSVAYALDRDSLYILDVTADSVSQRARVRDLIGGKAVVANGKIYSAEGLVLDPATLIVETFYDLGNARVQALAYDFSRDHLYYYRSSFGLIEEALIVVDALSGELLSEFVLPVELSRTVDKIVIGTDSVLITEEQGRTLLFPKTSILP